jgi:hypothetical protein
MITTEQTQSIASIAEVYQRHLKRQKTISRRRAEEAQNNLSENEVDQMIREQWGDL